MPLENVPFAVRECAVRTAHSQESAYENVPFQRHILNGTFYRTDLSIQEKPRFIARSIDRSIGLIAPPLFYHGHFLVTAAAAATAAATAMPP